MEDWTIQNRTPEVHEFHMHQIHFLLLAINGVPVPKEQQQLRDMVQVPYYSGTGPYPSVTVRMDFRGPDIGDFVYHCHILAHEDGGMMAIIRVLPRETGWFGPYGKFRSCWLRSAGRTARRPRRGARAAGRSSGTADYGLEARRGERVRSRSPV